MDSTATRSRPELTTCKCISGSGTGPGVCCTGASEGWSKSDGKRMTQFCISKAPGLEANDVRRAPVQVKQQRRRRIGLNRSQERSVLDGHDHLNGGQSDHCGQRCRRRATKCRRHASCGCRMSAPIWHETSVNACQNLSLLPWYYLFFSIVFCLAERAAGIFCGSR